MIDILRVAPTDPTTLSRQNGGVFPFDRVYSVIDGRQAVKGHGSRDMPVWGKHRRFFTYLCPGLTPPYTPPDDHCSTSSRGVSP